MAQPAYPLLDENLFTADEARLVKILIIEDEQPICQLYAAALCLDHPEYEVLLAYNGMDGIEIALNEHPDLVILDLNLPDISGIQVAQYLKGSDKLSATPIIVATGRGNDAVSMAASFGASAFLAKPFDLGMLTSVVEDALA